MDSLFSAAPAPAPAEDRAKATSNMPEAYIGEKPPPLNTNFVPTPPMTLPITKLATCNLAQWALDFTGNQKRIVDSIKLASEAGCKYRLGPELEVTGYSCDDHFYEMDTIKFAWKSFSEILPQIPADIICDIGMPVLHNSVRYNCRIFCLNKKILLIRPKMYLADDGNYRENRWFTAWSKEKIEHMEEYVLPEEITAITGQIKVPFGVAILEAVDGTIAAEVCEELFTPEAPSIMWGLEGVDIISNGSASHYQMGKRMYRHDLIKAATKKNGGVYMYSNQLACDGNRTVFDGNGMIYSNGNLLSVGEHLSFRDVEMVYATVNLDEVRAYRSSIVSRGIQADRRSITAPRVFIEDTVQGFRLTSTDVRFDYNTPCPAIKQYEMEDEMGLSASLYLWSYLTRCGAGGFFLPLSGGVDSSSTAMIVFYMCKKLVELLGTDLRPLIAEKLKDILESHNKTIDGITVKGLVDIFLHTCNMPTKNNSQKVIDSANNLAKNLGCYHMTCPINEPYIATKNMVARLEFGTNFQATSLQKPAPPPADSTKMDIPRFKDDDGDWQEHLAIQNIQARLRMVTAYYLAQIIPVHRYNQDFYPETSEPNWSALWAAKNEAIKVSLESIIKERPDATEGDVPFIDSITDASKKDIFTKLIKKAIRPSKAKFLLVLASSNADECLRGFFTKYDAGSGDLNPIGSYSKTHLRQFLRWASTNLNIEGSDSSDPSNFKILNNILDETASPELTRPDPSGKIQDDEVDITMTYNDLYEIGLMRKLDNLGPLSIFLKLCKERLGKEMTVVRNGGKFIDAATPSNIYDLVTKFFNQYGKNRPKMTIVTPSIHTTGYSPDDNRFDQRPFLVPYISYQFAEIKKIADTMSSDRKVIELITKGEAAAQAAKAAAEAAEATKAASNNLASRTPLSFNELPTPFNITKADAKDKAAKDAEAIEKATKDSFTTGNAYRALDTEQQAKSSTNNPFGSTNAAVPAPDAAMPPPPATGGRKKGTRRAGRVYKKLSRKHF